MSESRTNLEQILELLLAEENEKAEEMLHEYVVSKARAEYERVLDESEAEDELEETVEEDQEEVDEAIEDMPADDFEEEITDHEDEIDYAESGLEEEEEGEDEGDMESEEGEDDLEDEVDELKADLEDLRAEFEKLLAGEEGEEEHMDMEEPEMDDMEEPEMDDEAEFESVEYDLDEAEEFDVVEEATKLSDNVAAPKGGAGDAEGESPMSKAPKHSKVSSQGSPVKAKDGSEGDHGAKAKDHTPTNNLKVQPKKA
jgi:hypothetical protein